jgi:hypothetical protein
MKYRVGPWDCDVDLYNQVMAYKERIGGKPWTWVLHRALRDLMAKEGVSVPAVGTAAGVMSQGSPGVGVSVAPQVVPVVPLPVAEPVLVEVREMTQLEQNAAWLRGRIETWKKEIPWHTEAGRMRIVAIREQEIREKSVELAEMEKRIEAERAALSSESVGNVENAESLACQSELEGEI